MHTHPHATHSPTHPHTHTHTHTQTHTHTCTHTHTHTHKHTDPNLDPPGQVLRPPVHNLPQTCRLCSVSPANQKRYDDWHVKMLSKPANVGQRMCNAYSQSWNWCCVSTYIYSSGCYVSHGLQHLKHKSKFFNSQMPSILWQFNRPTVDHHAFRALNYFFVLIERKKLPSWGISPRIRSAPKTCLPSK